MSKRIGILTSGGDCAGLNAVIRSVVHYADQLGWEVYGILNGTHGLMYDPPKANKLNVYDFNGTVLRQGGTILGTMNKGNPFAYPMPDGSTVDRSDEIIAGIKKLELDAVVGIGGDGSFSILKQLRHSLTLLHLD